jgi:hypothetical protein
VRQVPLIVSALLLFVLFTPTKVIAFGRWRTRTPGALARPLLARHHHSS